MTDQEFWMVPPIESREPSERVSRTIERLKVCPKRWAFVGAQRPGRRKQYEMAGCETRVVNLREDASGKHVADLYARYVPEYDEAAS